MAFDFGWYNQDLSGWMVTNLHFSISTTIPCGIWVIRGTGEDLHFLLHECKWHIFALAMYTIFVG